MSEIAELTYKCLRLLDKLCVEYMLSRNRASFLKTKLFRQDERLIFVLRRFSSNSISPTQLLNELIELSVKESETCFNQLFSNCTLQDGKILSNDERKELSHGSTSLTYGEIDYRSFVTILRRCCAGFDMKDKVFIDLGSGTGRAVYAARLNEDFAVCKGVELLKGLFSASETVNARYNSVYKHILSYNVPDEVELHCGSITIFDWSDADVVFANSTCFNEALMQEISKLAESLKPGSLLITFTKGLSSSCFELLEKVKYTMSWGPATVFFHRRLAIDTDASTTLSTIESQPSRYLDQWKLYLDRVEKGGITFSFDDKFSHDSSTTIVAPSGNEIGGVSSQDDDENTTATNTCPDIVPLTDISSAVPSDLYPGKHARFVFHDALSPRSTTTTTTTTTTTPIQALPFLLWAPKKYSSTSYMNMPLIVFLHGASARGNDLSLLLTTGLDRNLMDNETVRNAVQGLVLSPQCPKGMEWKSPLMCSLLMRLIAQVISQFSINPKRVYLVGLSMGGLGAWMLAARNPDRFAALVPICGGGSPVYARLLKNIPSWFVHSADDNVIGVEETDKVVQAMRDEQAPDIQYSRYESSEARAAQEWMVGHNCWDAIFADAKFWDWLYSKSMM